MCVCVLCRYLLQFCGKLSRGVVSEEEGNPLPTGALDEDQMVNMNGRNAMGRTPLEIAASQGHTDIVRWVELTASRVGGVSC